MILSLLFKSAELMLDIVMLSKNAEQYCYDMSRSLVNVLFFSFLFYSSKKCMKFRLAICPELKNDMTYVTCNEIDI